MPSKKARAKAAKMGAVKSTPAVAYKVTAQCDGKTDGVHRDWTYTVTVTADGNLDVHGNQAPEKPKRTVGSLLTRIVCRNDIRKTFWQSMQNPSPTTSELAFAIFDRNGCLREEFLSTRRGSGIWGREFNDKCFQVIQHVYVDAGSEDHAVLQGMLSKMLDPAHVTHNGLAFALVKPANIASTGRVEGDSKWTEERKIDTFRQAGFRRVGDSPWFAKAYDPFHASNFLAAEADYNPPAAMPATALELLETRLELSRTRTTRDGKTKDISAKFRGHTLNNARAVLAAREAENHPTTLTLEQAKYGCTCGQCLGGFISPRMHFILVKQLAKIYKGIRGSVACDSTRFLYSNNPCMAVDALGGYAWSFVEEPLKSLIYQHKDIGQGYCYTFRYINLLLERRIIPTVENVVDSWKDPAIILEDEGCPCCGDHENVPLENIMACYFVVDGPRHGTRQCLNGLMEYCIRRDEKAGDDTFHWKDKNLPTLDFADEYQALPRCRNDSEFEFVKGVLSGKEVDGPLEKGYARMMKMSTMLGAEASASLFADVFAHML